MRLRRVGVIGGDHFSQGECIAQAQVEALGSYGVQCLCGVAEQCHAFGGQILCDHLHQWVGAACATGNEATGAPAHGVLQPCQPDAVIQGSDCIGLGTGDAMNGAIVTVGARQQGRGAVFGETFVGGSVGCLSGLHPCDEKCLEVIVLCGVDMQQFAHGAMCAIGTDDQACM